jgi:hypothetical protein
MQEQLLRINAVAGVLGSFVCDEEGAVLGSEVGRALDGHRLYLVTRSVAQTLAGLRTVQNRRTGEWDLLYEGGRLLVKPLSGFTLCILCEPRINVPLLNLTAEVAARKIATDIRQSQQRAVASSAAAAPAAEPQKPAEPPLQGASTLGRFLRPFGK